MHSMEFVIAPAVPTARTTTLDDVHDHIARARDSVTSSGVEHASGAQHAILTTIPLMVADLLAAITSLLIAWRLTTILWPNAAVDWKGVAIGFTIALFVANMAVGLYPGIGLSRITEARQASMAAACIALVFLAVSLLLHVEGDEATQVAIIAACTLLLPSMSMIRGMMRAVCSRFAWWGQPVLIVGSDAPAVSVYSFLRRNPRIGLRPMGIVGDRPARKDCADSPYLLGSLSQAGALARLFGKPWFVVAMPEAPHDSLQMVLRDLWHQGPHHTLVSCLNGSPNLWNRASACLDWPGNKERVGVTPRLRWVKRAIDVTLTLLAVTLLSPLLLVIAALIKLSSSGPVVFRQERVGLHGRRFICWKFRTMVCDGERVLTEYLDAHPECREAWNRDHKLQHDPRVTTIGRLLRKTSLDELPQLWNVLRGEMSLVGPRPILASEIPDFGRSFKEFCSVSPGITGLWQVSGRNRTTYAEHVELDSFYARNWSLWLDLYILVLTVKVVLFRDGAY